MIHIKSAAEIELMRAAGRLTAQCMQLMQQMVRPGLTTLELDRAAYDFITARGATPSFKGYMGYPASICASLNDEVVHGIPDERVLREGDIISIDLGAFVDGFHGDMARTFAVGDIPPRTRQLLDTARRCFEASLAQARTGKRIGDMGAAAYAVAAANGMSVVYDYVGHGIGRQMHEAPDVPNFGTPGRGVRLSRGMTLAVEPMINLGAGDVTVDDNGWTVRTRDGQLSAHYENTIVITQSDAEVLTML